MGLIMVDALLGRNCLDSLAERIAGIRIAVKFWEKALRGSNLDGDAMTSLEDVRRIPAVDDVMIDRPGLDE